MPAMEGVKGLRRDWGMTGLLNVGGRGIRSGTV